MPLSYDPNGRLWQATSPAGTRRLVYDGDRLVEEYDGAGNRTAVYGHAAGADEPVMAWEASTGWARRFLHADHQGSIVAQADDSGNAAVINGYDAWGVPNATSKGRFGHAGHGAMPAGGSPQPLSGRLRGGGRVLRAEEGPRRPEERVR